MRFVLLKLMLICLTFGLMGCSSPAQLIVQLVRIQGVAMEPSLKEADRILLSKDVGDLNRGDIVAFYYPKDQSKTYIKRIVGLPNEEIEVRNGKVFVNGEVLDEPYVLPANNQSSFGREPMKVETDHYYVLGDNRDNSSDSRFWGTVPKNLIYGKFMNKY